MKDFPLNNVLKRLKVIQHCNNEINSSDAGFTKNFRVVAVVSASSDRLLKMCKSLAFRFPITVHMKFVLWEFDICVKA